MGHRALASLAANAVDFAPVARTDTPINPVVVVLYAISYNLKRLNAIFPPCATEKSTRPELCQPRPPQEPSILSPQRPRRWKSCPGTPTRIILMRERTRRAPPADRHVTVPVSLRVLRSPGPPRAGPWVASHAPRQTVSRVPLHPFSLSLQSPDPHPSSSLPSSISPTLTLPVPSSSPPSSTSPPLRPPLPR